MSSSSGGFSLTTTSPVGSTFSGDCGGGSGRVRVAPKTLAGGGASSPARTQASTQPDARAWKKNTSFGGPVGSQNSSSVSL